MCELVLSLKPMKNPINVRYQSDQVRGGYIGIEYLAQLGRKKFYGFQVLCIITNQINALSGITQAAQDFGIELSTIGMLPALDFLTGEHMAPKIIESGPLPDAIFAGNDSLALGIMNYFHKVGIPVPGQISVLG
jgi:LacI family transcriptional regulator